MAIGPEPEVHEIERRRLPCHFLKHGGVATRRGFQIRLIDRHRVELPGGKRDAGDQTLEQLGQIAIGAPGRRDPLVDLEQMNKRPRNVDLREKLEHPPGRYAAADREHESASCGDRGPCLLGDYVRGPASDGLGARQDLDRH